MALRKLTTNLQESNILENYKLNPVSFKLRPSNDHEKETSPINVVYFENSTEIKTNQTLINSHYISDWVKKNNNELVYRDIGMTYGNGRDLSGITVLVDRIKVDNERMIKFLKRPAGILFNIKQFGLQLSNSKTTLTGIADTKIYNPLQLFSNISTAPFGTHIERHGLLGLNLTYEKRMAQQRLININRLSTMWESMGKRNELLAIDTTNLGRTSKAKILFSKILKFVKTNILNYNNKIIPELSGVGGPNSLYGIGFTNIRSSIAGNAVIDSNLYTYAKATYGLYILTPSLDLTKFDLFKDKTPGELIAEQGLLHPQSNIDPNSKKNIPGNGVPITIKEQAKINNYTDISTYFNLINKNSYNQKDGNTVGKVTKYNNFKVGINNEDYNETNLFAKYQLAEIIDTSGLNKPDSHVDGIYKNSNNIDSNGFNKSNDTLIPDLCLLAFRYSTKEWLQFRSTITGLKMGFHPSWNPIDYNGRPDPSYIYKGVTRDLSFSFITAAQSSLELFTIYKKLNRLAGMTAPSINKGKMVAPLIHIKVGQLIDDEPGFISSLAFNIDDEFVWDIDKGVPMYINVDIELTIIGKQSPSKILTYFGNV